MNRQLCAIEKVEDIDGKIAIALKTAQAIADEDAEFCRNIGIHGIALIKETSTNAALRDAATDEVKVLDEWSVGLDYREDVYRAIKAYADTRPDLKDEDAKLLSDTMRDYRRAGLGCGCCNRETDSGATADHQDARVIQLS